MRELLELLEHDARRPVNELASMLHRSEYEVERQIKVKLPGDNLLQIGFLVCDTSRLNTLVDRQQRFGAGFMLLNLLQNAASNNDAGSDVSISETVRKLYEKIQNVGFRNLPQGLSREMSLPRVVDIACVVFRLRENR